MSNKIIRSRNAPDLSPLFFADLREPHQKPREAEPAAVPPPACAPVIDPELLAQARAAGREEGLDQGRREALAEQILVAEEERAQLQALLASIGQLLRDFEEQLAGDVLSVSLELARLIVRQALRVHPEVVLAVVRDVLTVLPGIDAQTSLALNPADVLLVRYLAKDDKALASLPWRIVEDPLIERGGCRLENATTEIDATVETRWRRVIAALGRDDAWIDLAL